MYISLMKTLILAKIMHEQTQNWFQYGSTGNSLTTNNEVQN